MLISINQPAYLPWLGYYERIARSDIHVVLDHVQFEKNSMVNRNKIRTKQGWCWLTVPVKTKGSFGDLAINKLAIADIPGWQNKQLKTLHSNYAKARYFSRYIDYFNEVFNREWNLLNPLLRELNNYLLLQLGITTKIIYSSDEEYLSTKSDLILQICQDFAADTYLSGPFGRDYLDENLFRKGEVGISYQDYKHPVYSQVYQGFEAYMSIVDLLFNHGNDALNILVNDQINNEVVNNA